MSWLKASALLSMLLIFLTPDVHTVSSSGHSVSSPASASSPSLSTLVYVTPSTTPVSPTSASAHRIVTWARTNRSVRCYAATRSNEQTHGDTRCRLAAFYSSLSSDATWHVPRCRPCKTARPRGSSPPRPAHTQTENTPAARSKRGSDRGTQTSSAWAPSFGVRIEKRCSGWSCVARPCLRCLRLSVVTISILKCARRRGWGGVGWDGLQVRRGTTIIFPCGH